MDIYHNGQGQGFSFTEKARESAYAMIARVRSGPQWMLDDGHKDRTVEWRCVLPDWVFENFRMMDESRGIYLEQEGEQIFDDEGRSCHDCRALGSPWYFHEGLAVLAMSMDGLARDGFPLADCVIDVTARLAWAEGDDAKPVHFALGRHGHAEACPKDGESAAEAFDRARRQVLGMGERDALADARLVDKALGVAEDDHFSAVKALERKKAAQGPRM